MLARKAILIGSPSTTDYLQGVEKDMEFWQNFLLSNVGGAWDKNEICLLPLNPPKLTVTSMLILAKTVDYSLIIFCGHGFVKQDEIGRNITQVCINDNDALPEFMLNPGNDRCMIVLDCCRKKIKIMEALHKTASFSAESIGKSREECRQLYDEQIQKTEKGCTKLYAASLEQSASDENSFSSILIKLSELWATKNHGLLTINNAMQSVCKDFEEKNPQQKPIYSGGRRLNHLPFAIG